MSSTSLSGPFFWLIVRPKFCGYDCHCCYFYSIPNQKRLNTPLKSLCKIDRICFSKPQRANQVYGYHCHEPAKNLSPDISDACAPRAIYSFCNQSRSERKRKKKAPTRNKCAAREEGVATLGKNRSTHCSSKQVNTTRSKGIVPSQVNSCGEYGEGLEGVRDWRPRNSKRNLSAKSG